MPGQEPHSRLCCPYLHATKLLTEQPCARMGLSASTHNPRTTLDVSGRHPCSFQFFDLLIKAWLI